jgi:hypothetical protein
MTEKQLQTVSRVPDTELEPLLSIFTHDPLSVGPAGVEGGTTHGINTERWGAQQGRQEKVGSWKVGESTCTKAQLPVDGLERFLQKKK